MTGPPDRVAAALADRYAIERELGHGGMATVYLAEDLKHHRRVAIKVLKDDVSASVGAARFLREIEIAAQLQHPHILPLLDSGEASGVLYYVMPYVEGQSLRQRLAREGELPVAEAVRILVEVTDALAYAHARGVVHRDIKPDNIMLAGRHAVVADFGVARAVSEAGSGGTLTSHGIALGTPAYMAPEQAVADPHVDQRADIYALGVVAYELLAGRTPFAAATPQQMLAAHVTEKPDPPSRYRPGLTPALEGALMRCLEKRAADRFQSADDLLAILEPLATPSGGTAPTSARLPAATLATPARRLATMGGAVGLVTIVAFLAWRLSPDDASTLALGRSTPVTSEPGLEISPDISPDGRLVAYAAGSSARMRIFIRPVAGGRTIPLSDDSTAIEQDPKWSPDGSLILFRVRGGVSVAPSLGGSSRPVIPPSGTSAVYSADWSPDGTRIVFARGDSIMVVNADGASPKFLGTAREAHSCTWSSRNDWIACVTMNQEADEPGNSFGNLAPSGIVLVPERGGEVTTLVDVASSNSSPVWSDDGRRIYFLSNRDGPRDIYSLAVTSSGRADGDALRLTTGLGAISISLTPDGSRLAYAGYRSQSNVWAVTIPARRVLGVEDATPVTTGSQVIESMRVSPDGRWIIYDSNLGGQSHIWRMPVGGGPAEQLTNGPADEFAGSLSPDGNFIAYHSWRTGSRDIEVLALAGGDVARVTDTPAQESYPVWSPDGKSLVIFDQDAPGATLVAERNANGSWSPPRVLATGTARPGWMSDGRSIVWISQPDSVVQVWSVSDGTSRDVYRLGAGRPKPTNVMPGPDGSIYVKSHDALGRASFWVVTPEGGEPRLLARLDDLTRPSSRADFATDGRSLYFAIEDRQSDIYAVEVSKR